MDWRIGAEGLEGEEEGARSIRNEMRDKEQRR